MTAPSTKADLIGDGRLPDGDASWTHLHPLAVWAALVTYLRGVIGIMAVAIVAQWFSRRSMTMLIVLALVIIGVGAVCAVLSWLFSGYRLTDSGIEWRQGVFRRSHRFVAYGNIHAIEASASPLQRLFGCVRLTVSTGDSTDGGIVLTAVPTHVREDVERRRVHLATEDDADATAAAMQEAHMPVGADAAGWATDVPELVMRTRDIVLYAVTDVQVLAVALVVWQFAARIGDFVPEEISGRMQSAQTRLVATASGNALYFAALLVVVLIVLVGVSIGLSLLRYYGMHVRRDGDLLIIERGLLTHVHATVPVQRIRTVVIGRSMLRRLVHLSSVQIGLAAGDASDDDGDEHVGALLVPVIGDAHACATLHRLLPEWQIDDVEPQVRRTGAGLMRYYVMVPAVLTLIVVVAAAVVPWATGDARWWALLAAALPTLWWVALRVVKYHAEGYAMLQDPAVTDTAARPAAQADVVAPRALPNRIAVRGGRGCGVYLLLTRRACVQMSRNVVPFWRTRSGIGRLGMNLFVTNGPSELTFTRIRRDDAEALSIWMEGASRR